MILRNATIQYKGYDPDELKLNSHKRVCVSCDECGRVRWIAFRQVKNLCKKCSHHTDEYKNNVSGEKHHQFGKPRSDIIKAQISRGNLNHVCPNHVKKILSEDKSGKNNPQYGKRGEKAAAFGYKHAVEDCIESSCRHQGIKREDFNGFIGKHPKRDYILIEEECIKINKKFIGSHFHHLSKSIGIYIPGELHRHIGHNLKSGKNMGSMNMLALQFINGEL